MSKSEQSNWLYVETFWRNGDKIPVAWIEENLDKIRETNPLAAAYLNNEQPFLYGTGCLKRIEREESNFAINEE